MCSPVLVVYCDYRHHEVETTVMRPLKLLKSSFDIVYTCVYATKPCCHKNLPLLRSTSCALIAHFGIYPNFI